MTDAATTLATEITRVRGVVMATYLSLGRPGQSAVVLLRKEIADAEAVLAGGDVASIGDAAQALRSLR